MKIKAVGTICNTARCICCFEEKETQWIGDGIAEYSLHGVPILKDSELLRILDVTDRDAEKFNIQHSSKVTDRFDLSDSITDEDILTESDIVLSINGEQILPLKGTAGVLFIKAKYLKPYQGSDVRLFERTDRCGFPYIAIKEGLLMSGLVIPYQISDEDKKEMRDILAACRFHYEFEDHPTREDGSI